MKVKFWIHTNGGFKEEETVERSGKWSDEELKDQVEEWASKFHQWYTTQYTLHYGFDRL